MHHIQKSILQRLAFSESVRFSELQPEGVENKLFSYHLKQLIADKLVIKDESQTYSLTAEGKRVGVRELTKPQSPQAQSTMFLVVQNSSGQWLLYERLVHPLKGMVGFMHASALPGITAATAACQELRIKTGLDAQFTPIGQALFSVYNNSELVSFTHSLVLQATVADQELQINHDRANYFWNDSPLPAEKLLMPHMPQLVKAIQAGDYFYTEGTFNL